MLPSIRPRTLARKLGLISLPSNHDRRTLSLIAYPSLHAGRSNGSSSSPSHLQAFSSHALALLPPQRRHNSSAAEPPLSKVPPPFVKPPPFDPFVHRGAPPPKPLTSVSPRSPSSVPYRRFDGNSKQWTPDQTFQPQNTNWKQQFAIKAAREKKAKHARGEDGRTATEIKAAQTAYSRNLMKFLKESHNAFISNDTVADSLSHLGLSSLGDRIPTLAVTLMAHQVIGVSWMIKQEAKEDYKGGILADDMGLGKTIQMLALMAINRSKDPSKRMTLIVVPNALLEQWKTEFETKTTPGTFRVLIYHGTKRSALSLQALQEYDVVITTYGTVRLDLANPDTALSRNHWHRTVLDEAHQIRGKDTALSTILPTIKSDYRWTLTGTPVMNGFNDLFSQFRFLQVPTFSDWSKFSAIINDPKLDRETSAERTQAVMKTIMFRRTKESRLDGKRIVDLVPKTERTEKLQFSDSEREIYTALQEHAQVKYNEYMKPQSELKTAEPRDLIVQLLRLRQATSHPALVTAAGDVDDEAEHQSSLEREMERALTCHGSDWVEQTVEEFKSRDFGVDGQACAVCSNPLTDPLVTSCCRELICASCIDDIPTREVENENEDDDEESLEQHICPTCRADLGVDDIFKAEAFSDTVPSPTFAPSSSLGVVVPSTKMLRMHELVEEWLLEDPDAKIIIFSQWTRYLELISKYLEQEGHSSIKFTGGMPQAKRASALKTFTFAKDPKILLMSVKAGGVGLNIVRANKIIFMDLSWSPFVEAQAMARAHRIGQSKPVDVRRLVIEDSVEDVMLAIQRRKMNESNISLGEGGQRMDVSGSDLALLFGIRNFNPDSPKGKKDDFNVDRT